MAADMEHDGLLSPAAPRAPDVIVLDDRPDEVRRLDDLLHSIGMSATVLDRLSIIGELLDSVRKHATPAPRAMVIDLSWDFMNTTFSLLGRDDVLVPEQQYRRGFVMLRDVLAQVVELRAVPCLVLSNFLDRYASDFQNELLDLRQRGIVVEMLSKPSLQEGDALETLLNALDKLGIQLDVGSSSDHASQATALPSDKTFERAFLMLANDLHVSTLELRDQWGFTEAAPENIRLEVFRKMRLEFKILLAMKTVFGQTEAWRALFEKDVLLKGVAPRDALIRGDPRTLHLIRAELERRVGGPL